MITALKAAGLPAVVGVVHGLELLKGKKQADMRKWGQRFFHTEFAGQAKAVDASNTNLLVRTLCTTPPRRVHWRSIRSYILADSVEMVSSDGPGSERGTLHVRGYIRGRPLGVNQVVHLGDAGHFRIRHIASVAEPCPIKPKHHGETTKGQPDTRNHEQGEVILAVADPNEQEDLDVEAEVDDLSGEQTWPTDHELAQAKLTGEGVAGEMDAVMEQEANVNGETQPIASAAVPRGWSSYQAEWLAGTSRVGEEDMDHSDDGGAWALEDEEKNDSDFNDFTDADVDIAKQRNAEDEDARFPDEVDTPTDRSARDRFARFRALKSFRTSPWDPKESLPKEYARIFQVNVTEYHYCVLNKRISVVTYLT